MPYVVQKPASLYEQSLAEQMSQVSVKQANLVMPLVGLAAEYSKRKAASLETANRNEKDEKSSEKQRLWQ